MRSAIPAAPADGVPEFGAAPTEPDGDVPEFGAEPAAEQPEGEPPAEGEQPAADAPVEYDFGEAPEGVEYRPAVIDAYKAIAAKHKIAPDVAKDILATMLPVISADDATWRQEQVAAIVAKHDAEFLQKHGANAKRVRDDANRAFAHAPPALQKQMLSMPFLVRAEAFQTWLAAMAGRWRNDRSVRSAGPAPKAPTNPNDREALMAESAAQYAAAEAARNAQPRG